MKRLTVTLMVAALSVVASSSGFAADNTILNISAEVIVECSVEAVDISFGQVTGIVEVEAGGQVNVSCPIDVNYQVAFGPGNHASGARRLEGSAYFAPYILLEPFSGEQVGNDCDIGTYPAPCLWGVGTTLPDPWEVTATLLPFSGIPDGTLLTDSVHVSVIY